MTTGLGYTEAPGSPTLRAAIAGIYDTIAPDEVLVHSGAEEAIFLFMHAALQPGDHVIVHWPCYQSLAEVARSLGCAVTPWVARAENGWALDLDELASLLRPTTRAIVVNLPHNPDRLPHAGRRIPGARTPGRRSGASCSSATRSTASPSTIPPPGCPPPATWATMPCPSASCPRPTGWPACASAGSPPTIAPSIERMAALKDYTTICNSAPSEFLAELALRHRQTLVDRNVAIIRRNLAVLDGFFAPPHQTLRLAAPAGRPHRLPPNCSGEEVAAFCDRLVTQTGVLLLPGTVYDHPGNHFRIGFGRENFVGGMERLESFLRG